MIDGGLGFWMATGPPTQRRLRDGDRQAIPPRVPHRLLLDEPVVLALEFLVRDEMRT